MSTFTFEYEASGTIFNVEVEYEPAEIGSTDNYGLKNEPDYPELYVITKVTLPNSDVDLSPYLAEDILFDMEDQAKLGECV